MAPVKERWLAQSVTLLLVAGKRSAAVDGHKTEGTHHAPLFTVTNSALAAIAAARPGLVS